MSIIDDAIVKLQAHALALTERAAKIKGAPAYPPEDAAVLPLAVTRIMGGEVTLDSASNARLIFTLETTFHVSRISLRSAYTQLDLIIPEFSLRLAGDPTLGGTVSTIVSPISFTTYGTEWNKIKTMAAEFRILVKFMEAPTT